MSAAPQWTPVAEETASPWKPVEETPEEKPGFWSSLAEKVNPVNIVKGAAQTVAHPLDALASWRDQSQVLHDKAVKAADEGDYGKAALHGLAFLANAVPGLGQAMDEYSEARKAHLDAKGTPQEADAKQAEEAKLGSLIGTAAPLAAGEAVPGVVRGAGRLVKAAPALAEDAATFAKAGNATAAKGVAKLGVGPAMMMGAEALGIPSHFVAPIATAFEIPGVKSGARDLRASLTERLKAVRDARLARAAGSPADAVGEAPGMPAPAQSSPTLAPGGQFSQVAPGAGAPAMPRMSAQPAGYVPLPPGPLDTSAVKVLPFKAGKPSAAYEATARAAKAQELAKTLFDGGISTEDAAAMKPEHWEMAAQAAGVNAPSAESIAQAKFELAKMERAAKASPALVQRLQQTGSMGTAQSLADLLTQK